ncbi:TlpA family protein disulfide reductase [bacterium]|nr:TlpA family protein disulfide reductase [bacterium]
MSKIKISLFTVLLISIFIVGCTKEAEQKIPKEVSEVKVDVNEEPMTVTQDNETPEADTELPSAPKIEEAKEIKRVACDNPAPNFTLVDLEGNKISLSDYAGKVVILDFWAVWCGPCRMEIPGFIELQNKYKSEGLVILGVSLDRNHSTVPGYAKKTGINYPIVFGDQHIVTAYGNVASIPTTFIIDRNGCIKEKLIGYHSKDQLEKYIKPLLQVKIAQPSNNSKDT